MRRLVLASVCFSFFSYGAESAATTKLNEVLEKLQKSWDTTKSYQADFKQVIFSKRLGSREESNGILYVVKPGKLRWESKSDNSIQILNGKRFWNIHENKRRKTRIVDVYPDVSKQMDAKMLNFLAGKTKFKEWYHSEIISENAEKVEMKLTPRGEKVAPEDSYLAEFDKKGYLLRALTNETGDSRVRIDFSNITTNVPLEEKLFDYKPGPKDVVHPQ